MGFGFAVGDFIAVGKICWNVYTKCKDSPGNYKQLSGEVSSLYVVIRETELLLSKQSLSPGQQARLDTCRQGCESVLQDLDGLLVKYESLGTKSQRTFDRLAFGSHDMNEIRLRLTSNVSMLDAFNNASSHEKLEKKLDMLISEVRAGKREGSVVSTKSFGTAAKNNKETWDALRRELEDIGISPEIINEKKHFIVAWFQEAVAAGRLEEEAPSEEDDDSIAHSGSWSSAGNSDRNSVINQERPSPAFGREISKRSSCEVNNLDLPPVTISSQSAIQSPITEAEPEIENSDKSTKARKPSKGDKSSRLSVSYLLSKLRSKGGQLVEAAASGYVDRVRALLDGGAEIEAREKRGATALITAAEHGHSQIIQLLLDKGANVNATSNSGWTALSAASKRDETIDIVQMLLDKNADINVMGSGDPLRVAAARGSVAVLQLLIDRGANIESRDNYGDTALHWAARSGRERSVKLLIENGAAIEATNSDGDTALILAIINGHGNLVKLLLDKEANVEAIAKCGKTPLSHAMLHNRADIARLLLVYGAKIDIQDIYGQTPLHIAAVFDRAGVARLLLEYGAKTDIQDEYGRTPLQLAEKRGSMAVVWVLRAVEKHRFDSA